MTFVPYYVPPGWTFLQREDRIQNLGLDSDSPARNFRMPAQNEGSTFFSFCDGFAVPSDEAWMIQRAIIVTPGPERISPAPTSFALVNSETETLSSFARTSPPTQITRWDNHTPVSGNLRSVVDSFGGSGYWVGPGDRFGAFVQQDIAILGESAIPENWWVLRIQVDRYQRAY